MINYERANWRVISLVSVSLSLHIYIYIYTYTLTLLKCYSLLETRLCMISSMNRLRLVSSRFAVKYSACFYTLVY